VTPRVDLLSPAYWPEVRRGGERLAHDLATALGLRIVTGSPGPREPGVVRVRRLPEQRLRRRMYEDHLGHLPFLYAQLRRDPPDVAHALHHSDAQVPLRLGLPTVWTFLGMPHRKGLANRRLRLELVRRAMRADATLVLSEATARAFRHWLGGDPVVINPGIDLEAFTPGGEKAERFTVLCPANLSAPFKRADALVAAFAEIRRERPGARLVIDEGGPAGDGIEHRNLSDPAVLLAAYREAHVTALASEGEAFGLVLVESMACGTPAVARSDGGGAEITPHTFDGDAGLARAILDAAGESAAEARERAKGFSIARCAAEHAKLYADVADRAAR
jgi:glycosyltransferase involved in cell wall biosynthesis